MSLIQASQKSVGGGGGGLVISGFQVDKKTQTTNFVWGMLIPLSNQPITDKAIMVDYNGERLTYNDEWEYDVGSNSVRILFSDPYVTDYDTPPIFQITYPY